VPSATFADRAVIAPRTHRGTLRSRAINVGNSAADSTVAEISENQAIVGE